MAAETDFLSSGTDVVGRAARTVFLLAILLGGMVLFAGCASAPPADGAFFLGLENRWVEAIAKHDTAALDRLLDDSFLDSTFRGGLRTKKDVLTGPPAAGPYRSIRLDDLAVRRYGSRTAVVTGINVLQGASAQDIARIRFTDVFVERQGEWRAVSAQETLQEKP
ncbi:MAG: nuclear transport factor 2 family protein [Thermoanaerobaculia bacterium]